MSNRHISVEKSEINFNPISAEENWRQGRSGIAKASIN